MPLCGEKFTCKGKADEDKRWNRFVETGDIRDYLCYKNQSEELQEIETEGNQSDESDYSHGNGADISTGR